MYAYARAHTHTYTHDACMCLSIYVLCGVLLTVFVDVPNLLNINKKAPFGAVTCQQNSDN